MKFRYLKDVVTLEYDPGKCTGCRMCTVVCPHAVFAMEGDKAVVVDRDACMECGACMFNCQFAALTVNPGVGCASGIIVGAIKGTEPTCGCQKGTACCG